MPSSKPARRLADIIENADLIAEFIAGLDETAFLTDRKTIAAVERCLGRISEAACKLGDEAPKLVPGHDWCNHR